MHQHSDYVPLHLHTEYSLLDGAIRIRELVEQAIAYKMPAVAITDHGNLFGAVDFYRFCIVANCVGLEKRSPPPQKSLAGFAGDGRRSRVGGLADGAVFGQLSRDDF